MYIVEDYFKTFWLVLCVFRGDNLIPIGQMGRKIIGILCSLFIALFFSTVHIKWASSYGHGKIRTM